MNNRNFKTILLISMILLNMYLIKQLWFEETWDHNFFTISSPKAKEISGMQDLEQFIIRPRRIILNFREYYHSVLSAHSEEPAIQEDYEYFFEKGMHIAKKVFVKGKMIPSTPSEETYKNLIGSPSILLDFDAEISIHTLKKTLKIRDEVSVIDLEAIKGFNQIIILPEDDVTKDISCYFIREENEQHIITHFVLKDEIGSEIAKKIRQEDNKDKQNYLSLLEFFPKDFKRNNFLPYNEQDETYEYKTPVLQLTPSFYLWKKERIHEYIKNTYFNIPEAVNEVERNGVVTYLGSKEKTLTLYPSGKIEYKNQEEKERNTRNDETAAFFTAVKFMQNKLFSHQIPTIYLKEVIKEEQKYTFSFWQHYNGYPIYIMEEGNEKTLPAIRITVENNVVKQYTQQTYDIKAVDERSIIRFSDAWDHAWEKAVDSLGNEDELKMIDANLAYIHTASGKDRQSIEKIQWLFSIRPPYGNKDHIKPIPAVELE